MRGMAECVRAMRGFVVGMGGFARSSVGEMEGMEGFVAAGASVEFD